MISKSPMPANYLQLGRICAALYDGQWHRAEIIDVFEESVKVICIWRKNLEALEHLVILQISPLI